MPERVMRPSLAPQPVDPAAAADRAAIQSLLWSYCHAMDRRDFALLRDLYHDDAIDDHGAFCGAPDDYVAWTRESLKTFAVTAHSIGNALIILDGDSAEGEIRVTAYHVEAADERRALVVGGRYLDRYARRDGIWRFLRRAFAIDWIERREVVPLAEAGFAGLVAPGRTDGGDPAYAQLPLFAADRAGREKG